MLFLGISAGIPLLLIFSSLSLWLREAGVQREAVTYFSWAALGYSFKFVWAPLVDKLPLPLLSKLLGRRRAWLLLSQIIVILSIVAMAFVDPAKDTLTLMAWAAVCLGFSSATQDIVIDAYRIESADSSLQALMSSSYIAGYRIGMLVAGAGALFLASYFGSTTETYDYHAWQSSYLLISSFMLIGVITTLMVAEPSPQVIGNSSNIHKDHLGFLFLFIALVSTFIACFYYSTELAEKAKLIVSTLISNKPLVGFIIELCRLVLALIIASIIGKCVILSGIVKQQIAVQTYMVPIQDFFQRYGYLLAWLLLALIGLYRISDIVLGVISNVFYQDLGFTKPEIASVVKSFGLAMTIAGGFLGGLLAVRFGVMRILFLGALLSALTNLLFMMLAQAGHDMFMLYLVISADNLSAGLASAAFIAFLSSLTNISFTAVQYAIFSSLMTLLPKILGGYSGTLVETLGYSQFFLITAIMGIPVLLLIILAEKYFQLGNKL
ncbi:MAG: AmpG family muropeptide MFS transporter [Methylococcales symbiont of Iophon sp. n. MRB-2018]|nr:MAG: AmpG family muropeptide MFS transporter [Methylococcales symbiont of Iophon sp. n. MRB-2018]KAF3980018.1 MAG: AmpG family muropeptide MFS transporter [Methylococcales symbiont of Iophon sp. n. MRB-2018]